MGFNAGGANVQGVQAIEQGQLKLATAPSTLSAVGGETNTVDITVPAGKKWIIKNLSTSTSNLVGTVTSCQCQLFISAVAISLITGASGTNILNCPQQITLAAGQVIRFRVVTSAWTSGQLAYLYLYQEVDA